MASDITDAFAFYLEWNWIVYILNGIALLVCSGLMIFLFVRLPHNHNRNSNNNLDVNVNDNAIHSSLIILTFVAVICYFIKSAVTLFPALIDILFDLSKFYDVYVLTRQVSTTAYVLGKFATWMILLYRLKHCFENTLWSVTDTFINRLKYILIIQTSILVMTIIIWYFIRSHLLYVFGIAFYGLFDLFYSILMCHLFLSRLRLSFRFFLTQQIQHQQEIEKEQERRSRVSLSLRKSIMQMVNANAIANATGTSDTTHINLSQITTKGGPESADIDTSTADVHVTPNNYNTTLGTTNGTTIGGGTMMTDKGDASSSNINVKQDENGNESNVNVNINGDHTEQAIEHTVTATVSHTGSYPGYPNYSRYPPGPTGTVGTAVTTATTTATNLGLIAPPHRGVSTNSTSGAGTMCTDTTPVTITATATATAPTTANNTPQTETSTHSGINNVNNNNSNNYGNDLNSKASDETQVALGGALKNVENVANDHEAEKGMSNKGVAAASNLQDKETGKTIDFGGNYDHDDDDNRDSRESGHSGHSGHDHESDIDFIPNHELHLHTHAGSISSAPSVLVNIANGGRYSYPPRSTISMSRGISNQSHHSTNSNYHYNPNHNYNYNNNMYANNNNNNNNNHGPPAAKRMASTTITMTSSHNCNYSNYITQSYNQAYNHKGNSSNNNITPGHTVDGSRSLSIAVEQLHNENDQIRKLVDIITKFTILTWMIVFSSMCVVIGVFAPDYIAYFLTLTVSTVDAIINPLCIVMYFSFAGGLYRRLCCPCRRLCFVVHSISSKT